MCELSRYLSVFLSAVLVFSILPSPSVVRAQDLVATDSVTAGSSVFVFRESRKKPQTRFAGAGGSVGVAYVNKESAGRSSALIAAEAKKRRAAAAARRQQIAKATADRKIALSNTLTAKAETFLDQDQTDAAVTNFRAAIVQNPKNARAAEGLSNALTAKGIEVAGNSNNEAALVYFEEAAKLDRQNDVAFAKIGAIYDARGQKDKAVLNYEKALAINSGYSGLYAPLGLAYAETGEVAKAETWLQKSDSAGIDNVDSRFLKGLISFKQNRNEEAMAAFDKALEMDGRFVEAQYYRGQILDRMGQTPQAIAAYRKTLELQPTFAPASFDLGVAYYNSGDYNNAAVAYQESLKSDATNSQAHANLASTYRQLERYPDANAEYEIASKDIKNADFYSEWGYSLGRASDWEKAVAKLETAKELSPTAIDNSNLGWGYYNAAYTQTQAKNRTAATANYTSAKTVLETAVQLDPKLDAAYLNLGSTHNGLGEFQQAVSVLKTALGLRGNWVIATNQLGVGYRGLNDLVSAVATFKQVVNLDGNYVNGLFNLGEAYNESGNKKEAKKINDRLRKLDPAMATRLDDIVSGKAAVDAATQKVQQKVPKVPRIPF